MVRHPKTLIEFMQMYPTEEDCREALFEHRWPQGFSCRRCGNEKAWYLKVGTFEGPPADSVNAPRSRLLSAPSSPSCSSPSCRASRSSRPQPPEFHRRSPGIDTRRLRERSRFCPAQLTRFVDH
jgi:hypothetical protein